MGKMKQMGAIFILVVLCTFAAVQSAHAVLWEATFTDLSPQLFGGLASYPELLEFDITNSTGQTWTDFHVDSSGIGFFDDTSYSGPGTGSFTSSLDLDILGLSVADGDHLMFSANYACGIGEICSSGFGSFFNGNPTTDGPTGVPEPSTMLLLGTGLIGLVGIRRKFQI